MYNMLTSLMKTKKKIHSSTFCNIQDILWNMVCWLNSEGLTLNSDALEFCDLKMICSHLALYPLLFNWWTPTMCLWHGSKLGWWTLGLHWFSIVLKDCFLPDFLWGNIAGFSEFALEFSLELYICNWQSCDPSGEGVPWVYTALFQNMITLVCTFLSSPLMLSCSGLPFSFYSLQFIFMYCFRNDFDFKALRWMRLQRGFQVPSSICKLISLFIFRDSTVSWYLLYNSWTAF